MQTQKCNRIRRVATATVALVAATFFSSACVLHDEPDPFHSRNGRSNGAGVSRQNTDTDTTTFTRIQNPRLPFIPVPGQADGGSAVVDGGTRDSGPETQDAGQNTRDAGHETRDAGHGTGDADAGIPPQPTCSVTIRSLIGETIDRTLEDRAIGESTYPLSTPETSSTANPFSDGQGGFIGMHVENLFKIAGDSFAPFRSGFFIGGDYMFVEDQALWVRAETQYKDSDDTIDARFKDIVYQMKFNPGDNFGLPVCNSSVSSNWAYCTEFDQNATANQYVLIKFLDDYWIITGMHPPNTTLVNETGVVAGGSVELSKEVVSGRVNIGEAISFGNGYSLLLNNITPYSIGVNQCEVSLLDANNVVVQHSSISPGTTITLVTTTNDLSFRARSFEVLTQSAFISILSSQIQLRNGSSTIEINGDTVENVNWNVILGWKNKDLGSDNSVDNLRSILVWSTDYPWMGLGQGVNILSNPAAFNLTYQGLALNRSSSNDFDTLAITVQTDSFDYVADGYHISTTVNTASYIDITSTVPDAFSSLARRGNELIILFDNGQHRDVPLTMESTDSGFAQSPQLKPGTILMKLSSGKFVYVGRVGDEIGTVDYFTAGQGGTIQHGGVIAFGYGDRSVSNVSGFDFSVTSDAQTSSSFVILVSEDAGKGLSAGNADVFAFHYDVPSESLNRDTVNPKYARDKVTYVPVEGFSGLLHNSGMLGVEPTTMEIGLVTERGSVVTTISDSTILTKIARRTDEVEFVLTEPICR